MWFVKNILAGESILTNDKCALCSMLARIKLLECLPQNPWALGSKPFCFLKRILIGLQQRSLVVILGGQFFLGVVI